MLSSVPAGQKRETDKEYTGRVRVDVLAERFIFHAVRKEKRRWQHTYNQQDDTMRPRIQERDILCKRRDEIPHRTHQTSAPGQTNASDRPGRCADSSHIRCAALVLVTTCISMEPFTHTLRCAVHVKTFFCFY